MPNPTSTTSKSAIHATGISLIQHPTSIGEGIDQSTYIAESSAVSKSVHDLPDFYIEVPVTNSIKNCSIPATDLTSLKRDGFKQQTQNEYLWFAHTRQVLESETGRLENIPWAAYHASQQPSESNVICTTSLLPLFHGSDQTHSRENSKVT